MPAVIAFFVRQFLIIAVQLAIFWLIDKYVTPLLNKAIKAVMIFFGVDEQTATDILANEIITTAETLGLTVALSKAKLPLAIAERLGFTSKGFKIRKLPTATQAKVEASKVSSKIAETTVASLSSEVTPIIATSRGVTFAKVNEVLSFVTKLVGIPVGTLYMIAQWVDFGNWNSGAYQKTMQKVLSVFGLEPDKKLPDSRVLSSEVWDKVYGTYKLQGAVGISSPYKNQTRLFSREELIDLVDEVASQIILDGGSASVKNVIGATQLMIVFKKDGGEPTLGSSSGGVSTQLSGTSMQTLTPSVKVFTGIISNGVLGAGLEFVPRPDDLIESMGELQSAIDNNLSPFLVSLPAKIIYEVKVVSSIIGSDGIKKTGVAQTIVSSTDASGRQKTKTVINKWAVLYLYVLTDKGTRSKIKTIVLGPTDAVKFRPDDSVLNAISQVIPQSAITLKTNDIVNVIVNSPKAYGVDDFAQAIGVPAERINQSTGEIIDPTPAEIAAYNYQFKNVAPATPAEKTSTSQATTLYEFFTAQGQKLPSLADRAILYQSLGLGQSSLYVGTAEQNTKLLNELKKPPVKPLERIAVSVPPPSPTAYATPVKSGFFRPSKGTPVFYTDSGKSAGVADGNTDYNRAYIRT